MTRRKPEKVIYPHGLYVYPKHDAFGVHVELIKISNKGVSFASICDYELKWIPISLEYFRDNYKNKLTSINKGEEND